MTSETAFFLEVTRIRPCVRFSDMSRMYMKMNMVNGWNDTDRGKSKYLYNNRATWSTINLTQTVHSEGPATICRAVAQLFF